MEIFIANVLHEDKIVQELVEVTMDEKYLAFRTLTEYGLIRVPTCFLVDEIDFLHNGQAYELAEHSGQGRRWAIEIEGHTFDSFDKGVFSFIVITPLPKM